MPFHTVMIRYFGSDCWHVCYHGCDKDLADCEFKDLQEMYSHHKDIEIHYLQSKMLARICPSEGGKKNVADCE